MKKITFEHYGLDVEAEVVFGQVAGQPEIDIVYIDVFANGVSVFDLLTDEAIERIEEIIHDSV